MGTAAYKSQDGDKLPSVTTIIGRFKESGGLIDWAWRMGRDGKDYRKVKTEAGNIGTHVHNLIESHIQGDPLPDLSGKVSPFMLNQIQNAYNAYLAWSRKTNLKIVATEMHLVSERYRYGGTFDAVGEVDGKLCMLDWKTSPSVYPDFLIQLAAYQNLWEEKTQAPIEGGFHLLRFDKTNGDFHHHHWPELNDAWESFKMMRVLYDLDLNLKQTIEREGKRHP